MREKKSHMLKKDSKKEKSPEPSFFASQHLLFSNQWVEYNGSHH